MTMQFIIFLFSLHFVSLMITHFFFRVDLSNDMNLISKSETWHWVLFSHRTKSVSLFFLQLFVIALHDVSDARATVEFINIIFLHFFFQVWIFHYIAFASAWLILHHSLSGHSILISTNSPFIYIFASTDRFNDFLSANVLLWKANNNVLEFW